MEPLLPLTAVLFGLLIRVCAALLCAATAIKSWLLLLLVGRLAVGVGLSFSQASRACSGDGFQPEASPVFSDRAAILPGEQSAEASARAGLWTCRRHYTFRKHRRSDDGRAGGSHVRRALCIPCAGEFMPPPPKSCFHRPCLDASLPCQAISCAVTTAIVAYAMPHSSNEVVNPITISSSEMEMTSLNPPNLVGSEDKQTSADLGSIDVNLWYPLLRAAPVGFTITMGRSSRAMLIPLKVRLPYSREHRFFLETDDDLVHSDTVFPDHQRLPRLGLQRRFERLDDWVRDCCHFHQRHSRVPLGRDHHGQVRPQVGRRPVASSHERRAAPARLRGQLGRARSCEHSAGGGQWAVGKRGTTGARPATGSLTCAFVLAQCGLVQTIGQDAAPAQERTTALSL